MDNSLTFSKKIQITFLGRDRADVTVDFVGPDITSAIRAFAVNASGCSAFLSAIEEFRSKLMALPEAKRVLRGSSDFDLLVPGGIDHVSVLIREIILRARENFELPYKDAELCHCRAVPTDVVDRAIISGCHTIQSVARMTSAGTSCGTCKPDTESLIAYRLKKIS